MARRQGRIWRARQLSIGDRHHDDAVAPCSEVSPMSPAPWGMIATPVYAAAAYFSVPRSASPGPRFALFQDQNSSHHSFCRTQARATVPLRLPSSQPLPRFDAATIDGCGRLRFLTTIAVPLARPALGTLAVFSFIQTYNQYFWPLLVTNNKDMRTVQIGLALLQDQERFLWNVVMAAVVIVLIPAIFLFIAGIASWSAA